MNHAKTCGCLFCRSLKKAKKKEGKKESTKKITWNRKGFTLSEQFIYIGIFVFIILVLAVFLAAALEALNIIDVDLYIDPAETRELFAPP